MIPSRVTVIRRRLDSLSIPRGTYEYVYDPLTGNLAGITAPGGATLSYGYDGSLPTSVTWGGEVLGSVGFAYDDDLRVSTVTVNGGSPITLGYDDDGLLTGAGALTITRDAATGLLDSTALGGVSTARSYDGSGRLAGLSASAGGGPLYQTSYTRDALDRIETLTETTLGVTSTLAFAYDSIGRLVTVTRDGVVTDAYTYDANGNRLTHTTGAGTVTGSYDAQDRMTSYEALHAALGAHPGVFDAAYVGAVRAGERSGELGPAFAEQEARLAREADIRSRLLSASIYPFVLALVGSAALVALLLFVVPRFAELVQGAGAELPRSTAAILAAAEIASARWPLLLGGLAAGALAIAAAFRTPSARAAVSAAILATPLLGPTRRAVLSARVARVLGTLVKGGAPLPVALRDTADSVGTGIAAAEVRRLAERVRAGTPLRAAMAEGAFFDPLLARLVAVGEESGRTGEFLTKAADLLEERAVRSTERLVTLIEPAMMKYGG